MTVARPGSGDVDRGGIAGAALLISVGNVAGRILGLARESTITYLFGATGAVSAFRAASSGYNLLYELLIGGLISSALVPVFSELAAQDKREYRRLLGSLAFLLIAGVSALVLVLELAAPQVAWLLAGGFTGELRALTTDLVRLVLPAVLFMSLAGLFAAALYGMQQFAFPAFMAAVFNLALIAGAVLLHGRLEVRSLAVGVLAGALAQLALQAVGLGRTGVRPLLCFYHPAIRRIGLLALPVLLSLAVGQAQVVIDRNLASRTGAESMAWMANATTLIQFPLGLVATAVSLAALPRLARLARQPEGRAAFLGTLAFSLRLVTVLIVPATVALAALGVPVIRLLFEHGRFAEADTAVTFGVLLLYLIGLPFAAIDQCLILAFYARGDTLRPALVGIGAVGTYLAVALVTMGRWGMHGLVLANSAQWLVHAVTMVVLSQRCLGEMRGHRLGRTLVHSLAASALAAAAMALLAHSPPWTWPPGPLGEGLAVLVPGGAGAALYLGAMLALGNEELVSLMAFARSKLAGGALR